VALRAFKKLCKELKPAAVILNGDVLDFPKISAAIRRSAGKAHRLRLRRSRRRRIISTISLRPSRAAAGRYGRLAITTPGLRPAGDRRQRVSQHQGHPSGRPFPVWEKGWSVWINNDVVCKHRWKGGVHATHNNTVGAGKTMVTGHLHSQKVTPYTDYNGTRYGIDTGCVADPDHKAFTDYTEDGPKNWVSGFAVLKFKDGRLMQPELCSVWDSKSVQFRGDCLAWLSKEA
jgi:hypothetical protein